MGRRFVFLGAPGSGKGTWATSVSRALALAHLSTGDMLRQEVAEGTSLGLEAKAFMESGQLVPDGLILSLIEKKLADIDGFILDGFPRTLAQAEALDGMLAATGAPLDRVVYLDVPEEELERRITTRRVCTACGQPYNIVTRPPKEEGVCDVCGGKVVQRSDDSAATLKKRLASYYEKTAPLLDYYRERDLLVTYVNVGVQTAEREKAFYALLNGVNDQ